MERRAAIVFMLLLAAGCRHRDAEPASNDPPFESEVGFQLEGPAKQPTRFVVKAAGGPVTIVSVAGLRRGNDLHVESITPAQILMEPGTRSVTVTAIGDAPDLYLNAAGRSGWGARGASITISRSSISPGGKPLPASFHLDESPR